MNEAGNKGNTITEVLPVRRYRLIDGDGKAYAPFRLKPGAGLVEIATSAPDSKGGWMIEVMGL